MALTEAKMGLAAAHGLVFPKQVRVSGLCGLHRSEEI